MTAVVGSMARALLPTTLGRELTLRRCERLAAVSHLLSSIEQLACERDRAAGGMNDPQFLRESIRTRSRWVRAAIDVVTRRDVTRVLHAGRIIAASTLLAPTSARTRLVADAYLTTSALLLEPGHKRSVDGADMAALVVQSAASIARASGGRPAVVDACLWYIAAQSALSYTSSGLAKLGGQEWRSGTALTRIMRTAGYGDLRVWKFLRRHPRLAVAATRAVPVVEACLPIVFTPLGRRAAPAVVGAIALFHVVNGGLMGLNRFVPSFLAMHPAVLFATGPRDRVGPGGQPERRDDLMPAVLGVMGVGAAGALVLDAKRRRRRVSRGRDGDRTIALSSGSVLRYQVYGDAMPGAPLIVLEAGLGGTAAHWEWVSRGLAQRHQVLTYDRAGYGGSVHAGRGPRTLTAMVDDLVEIARRVADDRPVVLCGYSLGGYLAGLAERRLPGRVSALVLVDATHPEEVRRLLDKDQPDRWAQSATTTVRWMRAGLGGLLSTPPWSRTLPVPGRSLATAQARHTGTWTTAQREWRAARRHMAEHADHRWSPGVPTLVLTARKTAEDRPVLLECHRALAAVAPNGEHRIVGSCHHDSIVHAPGPAAEVAARIGEFAARWACVPHHQSEA